MKEIVDLISKEFEIKKTTNSSKLNIKAKNFPLKESNFKKILDTNHSNKLMFVDGGNSNIFDNGALSTDFLRIANVKYRLKDKNLKLKNVEKKDYLLITKVKNEKYHCRLFDFNNSKLIDNFIINPKDPSLRYGRDMMPISSTSSLIRRILEIKEFYKENDSLLVIDGSLDYKKEPIKPYMQKLFKNIKENNCNLVGISKTTKLITKNDESVQSFLKRLNFEKSFIKASEKENFSIYFANFHPRSKIFRVDLFNENTKDSSKVFSILKNISNDSSFLGYPYGLIKVDEFARITNKEISLIKSFIRATNNKNLFSSDNNAHNVLDTMKF